MALSCAASKPANRLESLRASGPTVFQYHRLGKAPAKHHIALRRDAPDADGCPVYYEHCHTRGGFDGAYTILYREHNPGQEVRIEPAGIDGPEWIDPAGDDMIRTHVPSHGLAKEGGLYHSQTVLMGNQDIHIGTSQPTEEDSGLFQNGDGDILLFIHEGSGYVDSEMGHLPFKRHDYVWIPKGCIHRVQFDGPAHVMINECRATLQIPSNFLNPVGQLKMDAPFSHRDFRRPEKLSEATNRDRGADGHVRVLHKRKDTYRVRVLPHHPFDVVGFDGTVYPVAFNIHDYQPKTSTVHLPPPIHTTFLGQGGAYVVCSFVPRKVDYHPDAIPCPYPHSSVDCDEVLWYVEGNFTSRKGVGPGSLSLHPMGVPHAPQPGRYEASMGHEATDEMAVMVDTYKPLMLSKEALAARDMDYHPSWYTGKEDSDIIT